ncbi:hypothetical protein [Haloprofundus salinisoli]|uniref:hypothetical protein n=1 Tax=Haloprofundus salinisoli TaxID=2876193 RepID=UPI001CCC4AAB|nr:hypothetical protein [Haloprofundus salinisoli]
MVTTPTLVIPNSPDSIGTYGRESEQFVFAKVARDISAISPTDSITFTADGTIYSPQNLEEITWSDSPWVNGDTYTVDPTDTVWFSVPKPLEATEIAIQGTTGNYELSEDMVRKLARPPTEFEVSEFSTPASVANGDTVTLTLVVENVGEVAGTFIGALNRIGPEIAYIPVEAIALEVEAGESATWTYSRTPYISSPTGDANMKFNMQSSGGRRSTETTITTSTSTETTDDL